MGVVFWGMTGRYLDLGKIALLLLAVATPLLLYQGYSNRTELLLRDASLRESFSAERNTILWQITSSFFTDQQRLSQAILKRELPDGDIVGLPPFPDKTTFAALSELELGVQSTIPRLLVEHLHSNDRFFSGMPRRAAAVVEILSDTQSVNQQEMEMLYHAAETLYRGRQTTGEDLAFLVDKLPAEFASLFSAHRDLLGLSEPLGRMLVSVEHENYRYLLAPDTRTLDALNRTLAALELETVFRPADRWTRHHNLTTTLSPKTIPNKPLRQTAYYYLAAFAALELLLFLLYAILVKYAKINRSQKKLLATTSHELRTPLAVMRQFAEMLVDRPAHFPDKYQIYHGHILRECLRMQFLVENLLSAAKFENVAFEPHPELLSLESWLQEIVDSLKGLSEKEIRLSCADIKVNWDAVMMRQVVVNLLENARIHAETDIEMAAEQRGEKIILSVRDFGPGGDLKTLRKVNVFRSRAAPPHGSKSGLGLGLYLVHRIVSAHGGKVDFEHANPGLRVLLYFSLEKDTEKEDPQAG